MEDGPRPVLSTLDVKPSSQWPEWRWICRPVGAHGPDEPCALEGQAAPVVSPGGIVRGAHQPGGVRPVRVRHPEVAARDEGDPRAVRAPRRRVADREDSLGAYVDPGEREHQ